ncbi:MAG: tetratricopeptide repeat protein [Pyrinomonadaceae bacterium]|nr:tetratricopeptide repeat protein [Pyrinomonadaceae bacterium]
MKTIPHYCQNCGASNQLGERNCEKCGTRLMLVVFPPAIRHDDGIVPSYYEDHLLERVTLLEIRLSQVAERLSMALDLILRQNKNNQSDHLLLETLIDSLNMLGTVEKDKIGQKLHKKEKKEKPNPDEIGEKDSVIENLIAQFQGENPSVLNHLIKEGYNLFDKGEEKQAFRTFEQAVKLSPQNAPLLLFVAQKLFESQKLEKAKEFLEKGLEIEPNNEKIGFLLAIIYADGLEIEKSRDLIGKLSNQLKTTFCIQYVLGLMSVFENDWKTAFDAFKINLVIFESPETSYLMGCVFYQLGKNKMALTHLQKAVEGDPNFADAWFMLALVYKLLGEESKSFQSLDLAWSAKEAGAECLKFMKRGKHFEIEGALPFFRLKDLKKNLIMGNSVRFSKLFRREVLKILNS